MSSGTDRAILDATRRSILDFGVRGTTLTGVARGAGVSRMTVYRRFPDVDAILRELMTREFGEVMEELVGRESGDNGRERTRRLLVEGVNSLRSHPLLQKALEAEPELMLPYLFGRIGGSQRHALALLTAGVERGQEDGSIRAGDPAVIAAGLLLVAQSFLYSGGTFEDLPISTLDAELGLIIDAALAPEATP
jgi:AcrR family transcriptional regulator